MNHADLAADLPFYANGTLDAERCRAIEEELATCEPCALELRSIETLRDALLDAERDPLAAHDSEAILRDVFERIDADAPPAAASPAPSRAPRPAARLWRIGGGIAAVFAVGLGLANVAHVGAPAPESRTSVSDETAAGVAAPAPVLPPESFGRAETSAQSAPVAPPPAAYKHAAVSSLAAGANSPAGAGTPRMLARTGRIVSIVTDVGATVASVQRIAGDEGGVVTHLDDVAPAVSGARHTAGLTLAVPASRFDRTMSALAVLGQTTSRTVRTEDLTGQVVDADSRLRNLRREETDLLRIMDRSGKIADVLDVEQQLASTREEIERLDGESKAMRGRVADATIEVSISDEKTALPVRANPGVQLSNSWNRSIADVSAFSIRLLGRLFELLAFSPYLAACGVAASIAFRAVRRLRGAAAAPRSEPNP